ncbi:cAMP-binding domain of CRP or a regulatory subunit of cAMP-dependent protein kinases [Sphingomonas jatrophae]|uniref:cAMP-binding domain of CRP or a regulatory subunit of cAMP-dependent protein kinases n=2 Tax=Sphingomonas jatrophae TaxID=1166337 RepID=A0A1I6JM19_9SPHN|nr:Crp/Fnr family transcriptional regulator [Sphingomonas jatrophae]SFR79977.1 cAMP-binding domain of CRP or a regulatory subunit of cAMP-dependent protein kinases [Sphingomonas jatrophae]
MALTSAELADLLPPHSVFSCCSESELARLLSLSTLQSMKSGETILEQGEEGDAMLILLEGVARVSMVTSNGREIILDYAEPGAVLGEIAVLDGEPRTASATALWKGRVLRIKQRAFLEFVEGHPKVAMALLRDMARRLRESDATIETDRAFATGPRLARFLKRLTDSKANGHKLAGDLSQSELGNFVGISRENINRQLSVWAGAGVIELAQGRIRILNGDYLAQIAEAAE